MNCVLVAERGERKCFLTPKQTSATANFPVERKTMDITDTQTHTQRHTHTPEQVDRRVNLRPLHMLFPLHHIPSLLLCLENSYSSFKTSFKPLILGRLPLPSSSPRASLSLKQTLRIALLPQPRDHWFMGVGQCAGLWLILPWVPSPLHRTERNFHCLLLGGENE